jgi:deoxyribonuclease-4
MSIAGGLPEALARARAAGCDTVQLFTKSTNQWRARPLAEGDIAAFRRAAREAALRPVVAHDGYLINLAAPPGDTRRRSIEAFRVELDRAEALGIPYLVTHPGAHVGQGVETGLRRVAEALDELHAATPGHRVVTLLETTAGQGSSLGFRFEQLARLLELVEAHRRLGVCLDTCHIFAAGYEIRTAAGYRETLRAFHAILGLSRLKVIHVNDSKRELGSRVDRHEHIGRGRIGLAGFRRLVNDRRLRRVPMILETPKGADFPRWDRRNLRALRRLVGA